MKSIQTLFVALIVAGSLSNCSTNSKKMSGIFICKQHYNADMVDHLQLKINVDGTIHLTSDLINSDGTYYATKDSIFISTDFFDMRLQIKGDSLIGWNVLYVKKTLVLGNFSAFDPLTVKIY